jgi:hypothetical protein
VTPDDREKLFGQALLEDLKARWQELLNFEAENNRWSTIYVTAIIAVAGWFVNSPKSGDIAGLINTGANAYLLLLLAFVNNLYTLSIAMKGYQIQQLGLYLYTEVRPKLNALTYGDSGTWERWRREHFQEAVGRVVPSGCALFTTFDQCAASIYLKPDPCRVLQVLFGFPPLGCVELGVLRVVCSRPRDRRCGNLHNRNQQALGGVPGAGRRPAAGERSRCQTSKRLTRFGGRLSPITF